MRRLGLFSARALVVLLCLGPAGAAFAQALDVNRATEQALTDLIAYQAYTSLGKTPNLEYCRQSAKRIVAGRPYASVEELRSRKVVSAALFARLQKSLVVTGASPGGTVGPTAPTAPSLPFPKFVDLSARQSPVRNQAQRNTCIAFSTVASLENFDKNLNLSEQLLYYLAREADNDKAKCLKIKYDPSTPTICDDKCSGTYLETAVAILQRTGLYDESVWPYIPHDNLVPGTPCHEVATWASQRVPVAGKPTTKLGSVVWLVGPGESPKEKRANDPMVLMAILAQGFPVTVTTDVAGSGWHAGTHIDVEIDPKTKKPMKPEGGHGILLVGHDYDQRLFKFKNSWDTDWGQGGYGFMTFDYVKTYVDGGYYAKGLKK
jgi:hypothetical protein